MSTATARRGDRGPHRFLARTFSAARWSEYDMLLRTALDKGWTAMDLEHWVRAGGVQGRVLILRHDVDQHPATAVRMARIEAGHGLRGTWYFRWRTCSPAAIREIRELGGNVGLHYETLTRLALERGIGAEQIDGELLAEAREELAREVVAFNDEFGPANSICAHGDSRVPRVTNQILVEDFDLTRLGLVFDAGEALSRHRLGLWMTDRTSTDGRWKDGIDPLEVLRSGRGPVLCLTHPNNWCSGASLWSDRLKAATLPKRPAGPRRGLRTGHDRPPEGYHPSSPVRRAALEPAARPESSPRPFAPLALAMRREILRHYYDLGKPLTNDTGLRTLDTNSVLAESRASTLERALACARVATIRGHDVLDLGCGFGALALVFAARGARVTALDPNEPRLRVGAGVADEYGLTVDWIVGGMDTIDAGHERYDVAVMNNSFCYLVDRVRRGAALNRTLAALRPGGVLVVRDPKRLRLRDQFTGLPVIGLLPPVVGRGLAKVLRINRSHVRLLSPRAARREFRRAGFAEVETVAVSGRGRLLEPLSGYYHLVARKPYR